MLNKNPSFYKDHINAKKSKQFLGSLGNVAVTFVISALLFVLVFKLAGDHLPSIKKNLDNMALKEKEFHDERKQAGLLVYDEENRLYTKESVIYLSIKNETKTALIHYGLDDQYENFETYKNSKIIDKDHLLNNAILFYFCDYKVENTAYYNENPAKSDFYLDFYNNQLTSKPSFDVYDLSLETNEQKFFTKETTLLFADFYFKQDLYESNKHANDSVYKMFSDTYDEALEDFNKNNTHASALLDEYNKMHDSYSNSLIVELFLSYFVASLITYLLPYLIKNDYDSLGSLMLKTPIVTKDGARINIFHELGIFGINLISNLYVISFVILIIFSHPGLIFHNFGFLNVGILTIFSALFSLISLILMLSLKNHQFLDATSMILERKNKEEVVVKEKDEKNGTN